MACYGDGVIEIPLEDLWEFVAKYCDNKGAEVFYGVPYFDNVGQLLRVDYMYNTECSPMDEAGFNNSKIKKQWDSLDKQDE